MRFRKSIKIAKGVRLNVSKSGLGVSAGVRGARIGVNSRGAYTSTSIPGTGLYSVNYVGNKKRKTSTPTRPSSSTFSIIPPLSVGFMDMLKGTPKHQSVQKTRKAKELFLKREFAHAEEILKEALEDFPENYQATFLMGGSLHNQGKYNEAIPHLEIINTKFPDYEDVYITLANSYFSTGNFDKTVEVIQRFPNGWENHIKAIQLLGLAFANLKKYPLAIDVFKKAPLQKRNLDDDLLETHYNLAEVYEVSGDKKNALKHFSKVYAYDMNYKEVNEKVSNLEK